MPEAVFTKAAPAVVRYITAVSPPPLFTLITPFEHEADAKVLAPRFEPVLAREYLVGKEATPVVEL